MNIANLMTKTNGIMKYAGFVLKKHSPKILLGIGVGGIAFGTVKACHDTLKLPAAVENAKKRIEVARSNENEDERKKEITKAYVRSGWEIAKIYIPAVTIEGAGLACVLASHNILSERNAALAAAYTTLDNSFKKYRTRVLERFGEQTEMEIRSGAKPVEIEETIVNEKGKEKKVKKTVMVVDDSAGYSDYARVYGPGHGAWEADERYRKLFLDAQEHLAHNMLVSRRFLFLNDVYELLGYDKTVTGQQVGWLYDPNDQSEDAGDNYVIFRRYDINVETENGIQPAVMLDFNVDGMILAKGEEKGIIPR